MTITQPLSPSTVQHAALHAWVTEMTDLCRPDRVHGYDATQTEDDALCEQMMQGVPSSG